MPAWASSRGWDAACRRFPPDVACADPHRDGACHPDAAHRRGPRDADDARPCPGWTRTDCSRDAVRPDAGNRTGPAESRGRPAGDPDARREQPDAERPDAGPGWRNARCRTGQRRAAPLRSSCRPWGRPAGRRTAPPTAGHPRTGPGNRGAHREPRDADPGWRPASARSARRPAGWPGGVRARAPGGTGPARARDGTGPARARGGSGPARARGRPSSASSRERPSEVPGRGFAWPRARQPGRTPQRRPSAFR